MATLLAAGAFAAAIAASVFLSVADAVTSESCTLEAGVRTCTSNSKTIVQSEGAGVLAYFAVQIAITGAGFLASLQSFDIAMGVRWAMAAGLMLLSLISGFSIGLLFIPGAALLLASTFIDQREAARQ